MGCYPHAAARGRRERMKSALPKPRCHGVSIELACPNAQTAGVTSSKSNDPLHGITLEKVLIELVAHYGSEEMGRRVAIRCFLFDPSVRSSLSFLRKTPWARSKVEAMYVSWKAAQPNGSG